MQISTLIVTVMASLAIAVPTGGGGGGGGGGGSTPYDACREVLINAQPQCCAATVGDIADLTCATVSELPSSPEDFRDICAETGKTARCCTVSLLGISLLCGTPVGL
ncbi:Cryparin [Diaporthe sp. PMI_573]|nr:Cryparin [Diaporthaceae sp. PMI_573]